MKGTLIIKVENSEQMDEISENFKEMGLNPVIIGQGELEASKEMILNDTKDLPDIIIIKNNPPPPIPLPNHVYTMSILKRERTYTEYDKEDNKPFYHHFTDKRRRHKKRK